MCCSSSESLTSDSNELSHNTTRLPSSCGDGSSVFVCLHLSVCLCVCVCVSACYRGTAVEKQSTPPVCSQWIGDRREERETENSEKQQRERERKKETDRQRQRQRQKQRQRQRERERERKR